MSLILSLVLASQTVTLSADPVKGPSSCAYAVTSAATEGADLMLLSAQVSYYAMHAARAVPGDKPFFERVGEIAGGMGDMKDVVGANQAEILKQCDARYPRARSTAKVTLPADEVKRDILCLSVTSLMLGAAQGAAEDGNETPLARFKPLMEAYAGKLNDERLQAIGITDTDKMQMELGKAAGTSIDYGNPEMISQACEANLKA